MKNMVCSNNVFRGAGSKQRAHHTNIHSSIREQGCKRRMESIYVHGGFLIKESSLSLGYLCWFLAQLIDNNNTNAHTNINTNAKNNNNNNTSVGNDN